MLEFLIPIFFLEDTIELEKTCAEQRRMHRLANALQLCVYLSKKDITKSETVLFSISMEISTATYIAQTVDFVNCLFSVKKGNGCIRGQRLDVI